MSLKLLSRRLEVIMIVSSRTQKLKNCVMILALDINCLQHTLLNPMVWLKERIEP